MASLTLGQLVRKYSVVIFFPTFTAVTIFADWSHTRKWKQQQKEIVLSKTINQ